MIALVLLLAFLGGLVKIIGGFIYGSKALYVDALTCIANFIALVSTIYYYKLSLLPPDLDHHYGHYKLGFGGALISVMAYSFVAGLVISRLYTIEPYEVRIGAPVFALLGFILYGLAIIVARRISEFFGPYSIFTVSELIESIVVITASLAGALFSYFIDYIGALILVAYIFIELYSTSRDLLVSLSDIAPPKSYIESIKRFLESKGFIVDQIKVRRIHTNLMHGDIVISVSDHYTVDEIRELIKELKKDLLSKFKLDASIEIR